MPTADRLTATQFVPEHPHPPIKVAVLGAGGWGINLVRTLHELGALAAVVEPDADRRRHIGDLYPDVQLLENPHQVWASPWSAVFIATPVPTHYQLARQALLAGKDVFVEKPLAFKAAEAQELVHTAAARGRILMVGHLLLYQSAVRWLKEQLDQGLVGGLVSLHQERLSLGRARPVENALWSLGVHDVAVLLHLVGNTPLDVQAVGQRVLQPAVEDDVHLSLQFAGGVQAHLHCSWLWPEKRRRLTIIGTKGMVVYDELAQTVTHHDKWITPDLQVSDQGAEVVFVGDGQPLTIECEHFLDAVRTRSQPLSDGRSGHQVVQVIERAQEILAGADELTSTKPAAPAAKP